VTRYAIVLSTRNGATWLPAQLDSISAQSAKNWRLYVRDDGSADGTADLLEAYAAREPRMSVLPAGGSLGAAASFGKLLEHALAAGEDYVFLSDQDDVWVPDKCADMLAVIHSLEAKSARERPLLVHSDLSVVDEHLVVIHPSFVALQGIDVSEVARGRRLLFANSVTGCACLVNASLLRCAMPFPAVAMHDWWLAQCAAAFGDIAFLDKQTVLYRQHRRNLVGAAGVLTRAREVVRDPSGWWSASARRFLLGLHQLWVLRSRGRSRGIPVDPGVQEALDILHRALADGVGTMGARVTAGIRSNAMPRALWRRGLLLLRLGVLPRLRSRHWDEREGFAE
jgi:glycosyltransferase involved in cell wall biosynthesis